MFLPASRDMAASFPTAYLKSGLLDVTARKSPLRLKWDVVNFVPFVLMPLTSYLPFLHKVNYCQDLKS